MPLFKPWINVTAAGEAFANLRQRNQFATLTNIGLAALAWGMWVRRGHGGDLAPDARNARASRVAMALVTLAAMLLAIGNAATGSRTGLVQLPLLLLLAAIWRASLPASVWRVLAVGVVAYLLASFLLPRLLGLDPSTSGIASRFGDPATPCAGRLLMWSNVLHLISLKPWTGWGWGELDYAHFVTPYPDGRFCEILDNAHNLPLHLAVELGVPVAVFVCAALLWLVLRARPWRETRAIRQLAWAVLALIGLHSLLEYPLWYGPFQIAALLAVWMLWRQPDPAPGDSNPATSALTRGPVSTAGPGFDLGFGCGSRPAFGSGRGARAVLVVALLLLAAVGYTAWDYHRVSQIYLAPSLRAPAYRDDTLHKIQASRLFRNPVRFAALTTTDVTIANAAALNQQAHALLHFSPESRVVEKVIDSALLLGRDDEAAFYMARYRSAFAADFARWSAARASAPAATDPVR